MVPFLERKQENPIKPSSTRKLTQKWCISQDFWHQSEASPRKFPDNENENEAQVTCPWCYRLKREIGIFCKTKGGHKGLWRIYS